MVDIFIDIIFHCIINFHYFWNIIFQKLVKYWIVRHLSFKVYYNFITNYLQILFSLISVKIFRPVPVVMFTTRITALARMTAHNKNMMNERLFLVALDKILIPAND